MSLKSNFKNQGGFSLVKNWAHNHVLLYALFMFLVLPKNQKGLEILRECIDIKTYSRLKRKYKKLLTSTASSTGKEGSQEKPKIIWFCWLQGIENAPVLAKKCYQSILKQCPDYTVNVITQENLSQYTDLPNYIVDKWKKGIITNAHFSDILRTNLLVKHGGTWIDSTVFLTNKIPGDIENAHLFLFRTYKPGSNGHCTNLSSWFISSAAENPVLEYSQELLFAYWQKKNSLCHYFLFHLFVELSLQKFSSVRDSIPKYTNETPHFLLFELSNPFVQEKWDSITSQSFCHKLTNKLSDEAKAKEGTFYKWILEEGKK